MAAGDFVETGLVVLLVFVAPGYLALRFNRALRGADSGSGTDLSELVWSILLSIVIAATFHVAGAFPSVAATGAWMVDHVIRTLLLIVLLSAVWGALGAVAMETRGRIVEGFRRHVLFRGADVLGSGDELWDAFMRDNLGGAVLVDTEDGRTFKGILRGYGKEGEAMMVEITPAIEVAFAEDGTPVEWMRGDHMLLIPRDVRRIVRLDAEDVTQQDEPDGTPQDPPGVGAMELQPDVGDARSAG